MRTATDGPRGWATSSAPEWVRRSSTTPRTPSAATPTSPIWPRQSATGRPGAGPPGRPGAARQVRGRLVVRRRRARSYADSLDDPGNQKVFQRHWIGLTPTDAVLPSLPGRRSAPLASDEHANTTLDQHERTASPASWGFSIPAPGRPRLRLATPARAATRWFQRCPASGASSRSTAPLPR